MENRPPKCLPHGWPLLRGFGGLSLANWGEIGQKLKRPISLFVQPQWKRVLTIWYWYVCRCNKQKKAFAPLWVFTSLATTARFARFRGPLWLWGDIIAIASQWARSLQVFTLSAYHKSKQNYAHVLLCTVVSDFFITITKADYVLWRFEGLCI